MSQKADPESSQGWKLWQVIISGSVVAALITAIVTWAGHSANTRTSLMQLLSTRETAQTELRSAMLGHLIRPFVGDPQTSKALPAHEARVLLELLTLNFHDHFEFKPLLEETDRRLLDECLKAKIVSCDEYVDRRGLRSVARRVIDRQIAMLQQVRPAKDYRIDVLGLRLFERAGSAGARVDELDFQYPPPPGSEQCSCSPDGRYVVRIALLEWKPVEYMATVSMQRSADASNGLCTGKEVTGDPRTASSGGAPAREAEKKRYRCPPVDEGTWESYPDFRMGSFDFPLTDNRPLDDKRRVALALESWVRSDKKRGPEAGTLGLKLVWFPTGHLTERERPMNTRQVRSLVGLD